jgi:hypothetical protein
MLGGQWICMKDGAQAYLLSFPAASYRAVTQPVTRPQCFPPFLRKNRANLLHIRAKR